MKIGYLRLDHNATLPTRAHDNDLGIDLYSSETAVLRAGKVTKVHTSIAIQFPEDIGGIIKDRSSVATKQEIFTVAGVIDPQYIGEIVVAFYNPSTEDKHFNIGDKIAQLVLVKSIPIESEEILKIHATTRGDKGFGSSGS